MITSATIAEYALDTVAEWLPGWLAPDADGHQSRVLLEDYTDEEIVLDVLSDDGRSSGRYRVRVEVGEIEACSYAVARGFGLTPPDYCTNDAAPGSHYCTDHA